MSTHIELAFDLSDMPAMHVIYNKQFTTASHPSHHWLPQLHALLLLEHVVR